jgi:hypothetical protein
MVGDPRQAGASLDGLRNAAVMTVQEIALQALPDRFEAHEQRLGALVASGHRIVEVTLIGDGENIDLVLAVRTDGDAPGVSAVLEDTEPFE